jgi:two-component system, sensor histidine kinase and response regulator
MTPRVLVVDDDTALLEALPQALRLRMDGMTVDTCETPRDALDRIVETDYDAIVSDIRMPGMDGLALLGAIRARRPDTPTLLITGHGEYELAVRALRAGAYDFIAKPVDRDYLVESLTRAIHVRELKRRTAKQQTALERCAEEIERLVKSMRADTGPRAEEEGP